MSNENYDNTLLICRSCEKDINCEVKKCPFCGSKDPFYFEWAKNKKEKYVIIDYIFSFIFSLPGWYILYLSFESSALFLLLLIPLVIIFSILRLLLRGVITEFASGKIYCSLNQNYAEKLEKRNQSNYEVWSDKIFEFKW